MVVTLDCLVITWGFYGLNEAHMQLVDVELIVKYQHVLLTRTPYNKICDRAMTLKVHVIFGRFLLNFSF